MSGADLVQLQMWLVTTLVRAETVRAVMHAKWAWPIAESLHFVGLTMLVGTIGLFDLRLLGVGKPVPIAAMHRFIRWGLAGFALNVLTGALFLMTEPDQYVYNSAFHFKVLFIALAGVNALAFYLTSYRRLTSPGASANAMPLARTIAAISLALWLAVIIAGRLLTFYRPYPCEPPLPGLIATCLPGYDRQDAP